VAIWTPKYDPGEGSVRCVPFLADRRPAPARAGARVRSGCAPDAGRYALWTHGAWWRPTAVVGLGVSTVLLLLYFTPWYLIILPVNIALIVGIAFMDWPAKTTVGA
jgi:hypothetical protein